MTRYQKYTAFWGSMIILSVALATDSIDSAQFVSAFKFILMVFILGNIGEHAIKGMKEK